MKMNWPNPNSIHNKINSLVLSLLIILSLLQGLILWDSLHDLLGRLLDRRGIELTSQLALLSTDAILIGNTYGLYELANQTCKSNEDVRYVIITDYRDQVLAHSLTDGIPQGLLAANADKDPSGYSIQRIRSNDGPIHEIRFPLEQGSIGYIRVGLREDLMSKEIAARMRRLLLSTLLVCLCGALISSHVTGRITTPLRSLADSVRRIRDGKWDCTIDVSGSDEVGTLGNAMQDMQQSLSRTNAERDTLLTELQHKEELRRVLLQKVITIQEEERRRLSLELHDEAGQALATLLVSLQIVADSGLDSRQRDILLGSNKLAATTLQRIRTLAVELRPPLLDDFGLVAAINRYVDTFQTLHNLPVSFHAKNIDEAIQGETALTLYRVVQESLTNVVKHAAARQIDITLRNEFSLIILEIKDDGCGMPIGRIAEASRENHIGIFGMGERVELLGGQLSVQSKPGRGTIVLVSIPISEKKGEEDET